MPNGMKEKFEAHAREQGITVGNDWTLEQVCDALIEAAAPWPAELVNEEGWQLWTAVLRRTLSVASVSWDEIAARDDDATDSATALEITFRLSDKREYKHRMPKEVLSKQEFGSVCRSLETHLREWKVGDDAEREEQLRREDEEFSTKMADLMEDLIGFRAWTVSGNRLRPIGAGNDVWEGGKEVRATCGRGAVHRAPAADCECGLYAWYDSERVGRGGSGQVVGAVQAYGKIQVHDYGFRAEYMRPLMLAYDDSGDTPGKRSEDYERVAAVAQHLGGVPVVAFSKLEAAASEHGSLIPPELRPGGTAVPDN